MEVRQFMMDSPPHYPRKLIDTLFSLAKSPNYREDFFDTLSKLGIELQRFLDHEEKVLASLNVEVRELEERKRALGNIIEKYADLNFRLMHGALPEFEDLTFLDLEIWSCKVRQRDK